MSNAFLFPGQAAQYVGMGQDLYEGNDLAKSIFDQANEIIEFDLLKLCFEGPIEELTETDITQPAVFTHSYASFKILEDKGMKPDVVAGHSLGEFNALVAAGVLSFEDALKIVIKRGQGAGFHRLRVFTQHDKAVRIAHGVQQRRTALACLPYHEFAVFIPVDDGSVILDAS